MIMEIIPESVNQIDGVFSNFLICVSSLQNCFIWTRINQINKKDIAHENSKNNLHLNLILLSILRAFNHP